MLKKIIIGLIINIACFSCTLENSLDISSTLIDCDNCGTSNVWNYHVVILDEFIWKQEISSSNKMFETVLLQEEQVVYSEDGYTSFNKVSGTKEWDNEVGFQDYGPDKRQVITSKYIYHNHSGTLEQVNIQSGAVELEYKWSDFYEGRLESPMLVHEGLFYGLISNGDFDNKKLKWAVCPVDQLNSNNWIFYENIFSDTQLTTKDISNPTISKNNLGETLLIYSKNEDDLGVDNQYSVIAYNLTSNKIEWEVHNYHNSIDGERVIVEGDKVYYYFAYDLYCLDAANGNLIWSNPYNTSINIEEFASIGEYLFVYDYNSIIQLIDKQTGEKVLIKNMKDISPSAYTGGYINGSAQLYNDQLYYINSRGSLMRIDIKNGDHQRYHFPETEKGITGPSFYGNGMIISDEGIIYTSDGSHHLAFRAPID